MFGLDGIKIGLCAVALLGSLGAAAGIYHGIQTAEAAKIELQQAKLVAAAQQAQDQRTIEALQVRAAQATVLTAQADQLKEAIHAAPASRACLASPAGRAFLAWMQSNGGSLAGSAGQAAGQSVAVPGATPDAH